jgi:UDP-glucose 4-epimerase
MGVIGTVAAVTEREIATEQTDQNFSFADGLWGDGDESRNALAWRPTRDIRQIVESEWRTIRNEISQHS